MEHLKQNHKAKFESFVRSPKYAALIPRDAIRSDYYGEGYQHGPHLFEFTITDMFILDSIPNVAQEILLDKLESNDSSTSDASSSLENSHTNVSETQELNNLMSLLDLLIESRDELKNRKSPTGNRYKHTLKKFCAYLRLTSGRILYEILSYNLKNTISTLSAIDKFINQSAETVTEGELMIDQMVKFLDVRGLPRVVVLSEDATRIVNKLCYNSHSDQYVGRVLPNDENSMPIPGSFPCKTKEQIEDYFKHNDVSKLFYVYMAQPVAEGAPSFCLMMLGPRNKFDAVDSITRLNYIRNQIVQRGVTVLAVASDGDPRLLKMHKMIAGVGEPTEYVFTIDGITVPFPELHENMSLIENPSQDIHHVGTKLRNRFADDSYSMPMGNYTASFGDLEYLMTASSKDKHKLNASDIDPTDEMNFKSVLKICSEEVTEELEKHVPSSNASCIYLTCLRNILHAYLAKNMSFGERMYEMFNSLLSIRYWRAWLGNDKLHGHEVSLTFILQNTYECIEVNAHTLFKVVVRCLEIKSFENFLSWLFGSQPVESFFRICRSQSTAFSTVVNCTVHEATHKVSKIKLQRDILIHKFEEDGVKIHFPRNKFLHPSFEQQHIQ
ncbi:hypothetical protein QAD02_021576 [Eretmocerus hayati]|uniref:Uncharacterized protein n=1 Tax=Eretmocerus hayati TaxID=131215 RepID=A0ACC2PS08_9HYME|nr:hypothetical protein QAD02_021576 [Eretmocerus hayati]